MKKITALIMLTVLLFSLAGCQGESEGERGVALRKGYYWEMPMKEILALAEKEGLVLIDEAYDNVAAFSDVPFSKFTASEMQIHCLSSSEVAPGLTRVAYFFGPFPDDETEQCTGLFLEIGEYLSGVYGAPTELVSEQETHWVLDDTIIKLLIITPKGVPYCYLTFTDVDYRSKSN